MKYKVTALTPVLVGDGRELAPIDYMVWKDQVNVLDQTRIFRLLSRGPRLEGYLGQLKKATKLDFASWGGFAQNFSQRRIAFEHSEAANAWSSAPTESLFIPTFASDHRGAYLPGSALKGALRTGLVFSRWSASTIERVAGSMEGDRVPRRVGEGAEANASASQMRAYSLSDSETVRGNAFKVYLTRVASLDTRNQGSPRLAWKVSGRGSVPPNQVSQSTPLFAEMAIPGTTFGGDWDEQQSYQNPELQRALGWRSSPDLQSVLDGANRYAEAQLELHARFAEASGLTTLGQTVAKVRQQLKELEGSPDACLLCAGWGGGFLSKAAFLETGSEAYSKILRSVPAIGRSFREGAIFPKTRRIVFMGGQPATLPGWLKLQVER
jgi:CRISPR-associated protein Csm5